MVLSLLPWGTHFKNHCFHTCKEGYLFTCLPLIKIYIYISKLHIYMNYNYVIYFLDFFAFLDEKSC